MLHRVVVLLILLIEAVLFVAELIEWLVGINSKEGAR